MIRILPNTSAKISTFSYICKFFLLFLNICQNIVTFAIEHRHDARARAAVGH